MKKVTTLLLAVLFTAGISSAQNIKLPPASKKASVSEWIGLTEVTIDYHRPGVKGRDGKIFGAGGIVPYDGGNPMPWRAGADENTTIFFQDDVTINGQSLKAGKYGFHIIPAENAWTLIFSRNNHSWGSYFYDPSEDVLRVEVKPENSDFTEWLSYDFINQTDHSADIRLRWERKMASFTVGSDVHAVTIASLKNQLQGINGFNPQAYTAAAQYCIQAGKDYAQALTWAERAADPNYGGQANFQTLSTKAMALEKLKRTDEAKAALEEALPLASMTELHFYGRQLISQNKPEDAMKIFRMNRERNPGDKFTTIVGLARGNMAIGNYKDAARYFKEASVNAPQGQSVVYENLAKECEGKIEKGG